MSKLVEIMGDFLEDNVKQVTYVKTSRNHGRFS